jgi:hypothetical protein
MVSLDVQTAYDMVAATGVLVAAIYYIINLRSSSRIRQAQLYMQVYMQLTSRDMSLILRRLGRLESQGP